MKRATAVIGLGFGDEGKGLMTDYHASNSKSPVIVCRFGGGANAGHTVQTPDGRRHIFSSFGSGTFAGASTFLSRYFIVNPFLWRKEIKQLLELSTQPKVYLDADALLSTPYDMLLNQYTESSRGAARHGSCGYGINETVTRCENPKWKTVAAMMNWPHSFKDILREIRADYVPQRIAELGLMLNHTQKQLLRSDALLDDFIEASIEMRASVDLGAGNDILAGPETVIFEGAQGLLLDECSSFFPHVTRARTGLTNIMSIAADIGLSGLDLTYVTRAYATRHGNGPFPGFIPGLEYPDPTNCRNEWQGTMRFGALNLDLIDTAVEADLKQAPEGFCAVSLAVTCLDQINPDSVSYIDDEGFHEGKWENLVKRARFWTRAAKTFVSFGPTRNDIRSFDQAARKAA